MQNKKILVSIPTHFERDAIDFSEWKTIADVHITGVGMVATTYNLTQLLTKNIYKAVLHIGIAGAIDKTIPLVSIVQIVEDSFYELGAEDNEKFINLSHMGMEAYDYQNQKGNIAVKHLQQVHGITVNKVHGNANTIRILEQKSKYQVETMESAAVMFVCNQLAIPFLNIKSISNYVEPRNKANWKIQEALQTLNLFIKDKKNKEDICQLLCL